MNGAAIRSTARTTKSCTMENRCIPNRRITCFAECPGCTVTFIQLSINDCYNAAVAQPHRWQTRPAFRVSQLTRRISMLTFFKTVPVPARPLVPRLLLRLPTNSTPSSRPDTSRRPGDLPLQASFRSEVVDMPGTPSVHRHRHDYEPGPERCNTSSCPY